nr:hypothetical protein [Tanacetum cinerariifolium]
MGQLNQNPPSVRICKDYASTVITRSKLNYFLLIKKKLDVKRRILFRSTCFGPWLDLMLFDHEPPLIDYMLRRQHKVDDQHHDMPLIYYMEGHSLHFGRREFSLIIGFRFETLNFDLHPSSDLKFHNRVFPNKISFINTNLDIIGVIKDEKRFGKLSDDDAINLCLLLALEVIFMGRLLSFKVDDTLFRLVENLEAWNSFPWGKHLWCHLYDKIKNLKQRHSDEHYYGLKKDRNYVSTYTLFGFLFAFQKSRSTSDLRPTIAEYQSLRVDNNVYFQEHVPRTLPIKEQHSLFETYLAKLEKAHKHGKTGFMVSSIIGTSDNSVKKKWVNDLVIMELNYHVLKLKTIIQVLAHERNNRQPKLQFTDALRCMTSELCDSLNSLFVDLIQQHDSDEDISQDYLREEELRLCLEDEEMLRCEHEKLIVEDNRFRLDEANRLRLEEENMLQLDEQKKNKRKEFMNSSDGKHILAKLAPMKRNQLGSFAEKINSKERHEQILKLQSLVGSNVVAESVRLLKEFQYDDMKSSRSMMRLICETQLKVQLPVVLECENVFQKKGTYPSKLAHGLSLDVDDPVDVALSYREKMV